jgi:hypothetical protein
MEEQDDETAYVPVWAVVHIWHDRDSVGCGNKPRKNRSFFLSREQAEEELDRSSRGVGYGYDYGLKLEEDRFVARRKESDSEEYRIFKLYGTQVLNGGTQ